MADAPDDDPVCRVLSHYWRLCAEYETTTKNLESLQSHQKSLLSQINDCFAAARLFGFDLLKEFKRETKNDRTQLSFEAPEPIAPPVPSVAPTPSPGLGRVKNRILDAARRAHPQPVRATTLRTELASAGFTIHEKTVGMTLYRLLSKDKLLRRVGHDWYYVPPPPPATANLNGHHYGVHEQEALLAAGD
jgi:hypothetical protein